MRAKVTLVQRLNPADRVQFLSLMVNATIADALISVDPELRREILRNVAETYLVFRERVTLTGQRYSEIMLYVVDCVRGGTAAGP